MILLKELSANVSAMCTSSTLKSTSSASRAISAVAELLVCLKTGIALYGLVRYWCRKYRMFNDVDFNCMCNIILNFASSVHFTLPHMTKKYDVGRHQVTGARQYDMIRWNDTRHR